MHQVAGQAFGLLEGHLSIGRQGICRHGGFNAAFFHLHMGNVA